MRKEFSDAKSSLWCFASGDVHENIEALRDDPVSEPEVATSKLQKQLLFVGPTLPYNLRNVNNTIGNSSFTHTQFSHFYVAFRDKHGW